MKFPSNVTVAGDTSYRNKKCPKESAEQITLFSEMRKNMPEVGAIAIHVRNEGKRTWEQAAMQKAEGMVTGACDVIIPGCPSLVMEIKRKDHTMSKWQPGQQEYMEAAANAGSVAVVALGWEAAYQFIEQWWRGNHGE